MQSMGWMSKVLGKIGVTEEVAAHHSIELIHVYELADWLEKQSQQRIIEHSLDNAAQDYLNQLKDKCWQLESKLAEIKFPRHGEEEAIALHAKKLIDLVKKHDNFSLPKIMSLHAEGEFILEKITNRLTTSITNSEHQFMPLLVRIVEEIRILKDTFEQKITQSGLRNINTLIQKAKVIEGHTETIKELEGMLRARREHLTGIREKREEKEADLKSLQENAIYPVITRIKEQRAKLLQDLEKSESQEWRTQLRQQLQALEASTGNRNFVLKLDDAEYRLDHFRKQEEKITEEISLLDEEQQENTILRNRQTELLTNMVKISLGKEVSVKT